MGMLRFVKLGAILASSLSMFGLVNLACFFVGNECAVEGTRMEKLLKTDHKGQKGTKGQKGRRKGQLISGLSAKIVGPSARTTRSS